ncbi:MAG: UDP-N-acetylmuramoyl-tripeptide--D-alanyl-D-alanine ligase [Candidatus Yonathbacteria bacterium]|nr:UDP-N-acetylmuramoyl-tripeptide--D-alanyl-D-alanine ligase [Candidatus Yonathbacteria bacterium]
MSPKTFARNIVLAILSWEARTVLSRYKPRVIAITGSVGKTSTKDAICAVLKDSYSVRGSAKSFNSEFGVPLSILGLSSGWDNPLVWLNNIVRGFLLILWKQDYPEWLVLEVGADHPGDIAHIATWLSIDVAVITTIGDTPVHVEFYPSVEDVAREKSCLLDALKKNGTAIINADDALVANMKHRAEGKTVVTYGLRPEHTISAQNIHIAYTNDVPSGLTFDIIVQGTPYPVLLPHTIGFHHTYVSLAAFAVAHILGITPNDIVARLGRISATPGRLRMLEGVRGTHIIDDTYNASPVAVLAGLETLKTLHTSGKKIAVLGDMRELGSYAPEAHARVGAAAAQSADTLLCVGEYCPHVIRGAQSSGMSLDRIVICTDAYEAGTYLNEHITEGDMIFVKGSQSMRMERTVESIMAHPEKKHELLVRQEEEWRKR